jgi:hypothetical protein
MLIKLLSLCLLSLLYIAPAVYAEETSLFVYDLKILGYKLGMTYDEAISTTAFHYTVYPDEKEAIGIINSVYIEDVEFNAAAYFQNDSLFKIICRFDPQHFEKVTHSLKKVLGTGEDNSKTIHTVSGTVIRQNIFLWIYPGARINLIGLSNNAEFATLSMVVSNKTAMDSQP